MGYMFIGTDHDHRYRVLATYSQALVIGYMITGTNNGLHATWNRIGTYIHIHIYIYVFIQIHVTVATFCYWYTSNITNIDADIFITDFFPHPYIFTPVW